MRTDASAYSRRSAVADSLWAAQDRLRSGLPAAVHRCADVAAWPLERVSFALRKKVIWPAEDRAETMGTPARALASGAAVLLAAGVGVAGLIWAAPDGPHDAGTTQVAATVTPSLPRAGVPVSLHKVQGRGRVELVQTPNPGNDYVAVVRITDEKSGAGDYEFELSWRR